MNGIGLRLNSGLVAREGDPLHGQQQEEEEEGLAPWAAALADALLSSHCAACFGTCAPPASRFPCLGPCQGTLAYCSLSCRDLDLPLHTCSGECNLLSLLLSPSSTSSRSSLFLDESSSHTRLSFPSLGGTCDLRAGLRLLAHHQALHHVAPFLEAYGSRLECPRLGGLLSNRSTLLQPTPADDLDKIPELEEEELLIAAELQEAAMFMHQARYSTSLEPCVCSTSGCNKGIDHVPGTQKDVCMGDERAQGHVNASMDVCTSTTGHLGNKHLANIASMHGNVHTFEDVYMETSGYLGTHEPTDESIHTQKDVHVTKSGHGHTHKAIQADTAASSLALWTPADELLLVEEVICQVFTNGVRVQVDTWFSDGHSFARLEDLGTAVYGPLLSWINHSCRPNAFYSFVLAGPTTCKGNLKAPLVPDRDVKGLEDAWGLKSCCFPWLEMGNFQGRRHHGPRACLHSIGKIKGQEPVYISYVDLLQPKVLFERGTVFMRGLFVYGLFLSLAVSIEIFPACMLKLLMVMSGMSTLEDWLHEEAQRGLSELLNNDNPLSCCKIMEDALTRVVHEAYQNWLRENALPVYATRLESFNHYGGHTSCTEASERHAVQLDLHLMHRLCLDVYMALSSSYKVLANGFNSSCFVSSSMYEGSTSQERKEVEYSLASAIYTLTLAATIQYMCDYGEPGILGIAACSWLQTGEAFVNLILKLDSYFFLDGSVEMPKLFHQLDEKCSEPMFLSCEKEFLSELKKALNAHGRLSEEIYPCTSTIELLRCMITSLWPVLRNASPFLSYIETPFDINRVFFGTSRKRAHVCESKDVWICHRAEAFVSALCSLQQGLKLMNICYGFSEERTVALRGFLSSLFCKT